MPRNTNRFDRQKLAENGLNLTTAPLLFGTDLMDLLPHSIGKTERV
jgi:hypothetical protein